MMHKKSFCCELAQFQNDFIALCEVVTLIFSLLLWFARGSNFHQLYFIVSMPFVVAYDYLIT